MPAAALASTREAMMVFIRTRNQLAANRSPRAAIQLAIVSILSALSVTPAAAQFLSADNLHAWCKSNRSLASAYAAGMADEAAHSLFVLDSVKPMSSVDAASSALIATSRIGTELIGGSCRPPE